VRYEPRQLFWRVPPGRSDLSEHGRGRRRRSVGRRRRRLGKGSASASPPLRLLLGQLALQLQDL